MGNTVGFKTFMSSGSNRISPWKNPILPPQENMIPWNKIEDEAQCFGSLKTGLSDGREKEIGNRQARPSAEQLLPANPDTQVGL